MTTNIKIAFFAIMKNESKIVERCLTNLNPIVDYFCISDTGSTDNTVELIENFIVKNKKKGKVFKDTWVNFGTNRSLSFTNAVQWLEENNIDKNTTYLLTVDADMILKIEKDFNKQSLMTNKSWVIPQVNPSIRYYNSRLFCANVKYNCVGVTHEYWNCMEKENYQSGKLDSLWIDDIGDGGAKADKYERDLRLLTQGIIDEPNNERYLFYLAQTYLDIGDKENAIKWYTKRIEKKGWFEEVLIACTRLGDLYMSIGNPEKALFAWADGFNYNPYRAEPLIRMANYYRCKGMNNIAFVYLRQMARIPYPKDQVLFVEHKVYNYGFYEELSISGNYIEDKRCGLQACNYLTLYKDIPKELENMTLRNIYYYLKPFQWDFHQKFELSDINKDVWKSSSSALMMGKNVCGVVRAVNYSINDKFQYSIRDPNNTVRTKNFWTVFKKDENKKMTLKTCYEIQVKCPKIRDSHIEGLEDLKIVSNGKNIYGIATDWERGKHNHPSIIIAHLNQTGEGKYIIDKIVPTYYENDKCQKNWAPFIMNKKLHVIYSHQPLIILELDTETGIEKVVYNKMPKYNLEHMRGSSNPIQLKNGDWIVCVHIVTHLDTRKYYHRILKYSSTWDILEISDPFCFQKAYVEFTLSIFIDKDHKDKDKEILYIPYSSCDNTTEIVGIKIDNIPWVPQDIRKYIQEII